MEAILRRQINLMRSMREKGIGKLIRQRVQKEPFLIFRL